MKDGMGAPKLTETDLQLYLAGALPRAKGLMLRWALLMDRDLRAELRGLRAGNEAYRKKEMRRLHGILFPDAPAQGLAANARAARDQATQDRTAGGRFGFGAMRLGPALAGAFSVAVLCALPWVRPAPAGNALAPALDESSGAGPAVIAKGRGLGVSLFVKGDSAYRVENQTALVAASDTLQVMPLGTEPQHLVLLGWDARQGLVRLFPLEGDRSKRVSRRDPPPALLLQDMSDNRLICVTATGPFRIADAESALAREPFRPMQKAPPSHLQNGLYLQVFTVAKGGGRI
jgi:hypothetical protein